MTEVPFGPTGKVVYDRTYSRTKANGEKETWPETVSRVAQGNLALVHGTDPLTWPAHALHELDELRDHMLDFRIIPAGRHLWASGVKGRQYLFNCHVAGWGEKLSEHFEFTFLRLMEGGGVGANYGSKYLAGYGLPRRGLTVHIVCDRNHPDYEDMQAAGLLSSTYDSDWEGAYEVPDSREGWAGALTDLIDTFMSDETVRHENRVYDVSNVRGKGSRLKTFGGTASGPLPFARMMLTVGEVLSGARFNAFPIRLVTGLDGSIYADADASLTADHLTPVQAMEIDHAIAECVVSGGNRRSARMAMVPWNDPFVFEFIECKRDSGKHWTTNLSVVVDDWYNELIQNPSPLGDLGLGDVAAALRVHRAVTKGMLTNGEPGYWNQSLSQAGEVGEVIATNPCGEIALEAWENCNLGHVNLDAFAHQTHFELEDAHRLMTRFLIRATFGDVNDERQAEKLASNRRIGVGHLGVQGYWAKQGVRYSDVPRDSRATWMLQKMQEAVREEARSYAFELRIPEPVKVTAIAPTGSIAKLPGVTEGIHPIYARWFDRRVRFSMADPAQRATVDLARAEGFAVEVDSYDPTGNTMIVVYPTKEKLVAEVEALGFDPAIVESADEISMGAMLAFQRMYQRNYADNAVSFTVNVPAEQHQLDALARGDQEVPVPSPDRVFEAMCTLAGYLPYLKGTTVMLDGSRPQAPYTRITAEQYEAALVKTIEDGTDLDCSTGACPVR